LRIGGLSPFRLAEEQPETTSRVDQERDRTSRFDGSTRRGIIEGGLVDSLGAEEDLAASVSSLQRQSDPARRLSS
jgi:hypothetical protein